MIKICPTCGAPINSDEVFIEWDDNKKEFLVRLGFVCNYCDRKTQEKTIKELPSSIAKKSYCACGTSLSLANYTIKSSEYMLYFEAIYVCDKCNTGLRWLLNSVKSSLLSRLRNNDNILVTASRFKLKRKRRDKVLQNYQEKIENYHQDNTKLLEIIEKMSEKEIHKKEMHFHGNVASVENQGSIGSSGNQNPIGNVAVDVKGDQKSIQHIRNYAPEQKPTLAEAAAEIQQLLEQLSKTYPTTTTAEKMAVVAEAAEQIEKNPTLKARVINAIKLGGTEAFKETINHPLLNILMATIEGWQDAD